MKTSLILLSLIINCTLAQAMLIPTTSIGNVNNDGTWGPTGNTYISGNKGGFAYGFSLSESYRISSITGFINGLSDFDRNGTYKSGSYQMTLLKGSYFRGDSTNPLPNDTSIFQTDFFSTYLDSTSRPYTKQTDLTLDSGQYWLHFYGGAEGPVSVRASGYELHGDEFSSIHNPEPATMLMILGGLVGAWRMRRKK